MKLFLKVFIISSVFLFSCSKESEDPQTTITTNGGSSGSWSKQSSGTSENLNDVFFLDKNKGWAVGFSGTILHTNNGGVTWSDQSISDDEVIFQSLQFVSETVGFAIGLSYSGFNYNGAYLYKTTNGGSSWSSVLISSTDDIFDLYFFDASSGVVVGGYEPMCSCTSGSVYYTSDAGATWSGATFGYDAFNTITQTDQAFRGVDFVSTTVGYIGGDNGDVFKTTDGGKNWYYETTNAGSILYDIKAVTSNNIVAVGSSNTIIQSLNGSEFKFVSQTNYNVNHAVDFADANEGWTVANYGVNDIRIFYTSDGGKKWSVQKSPTKESLKGVSFVDNTRGWAVGDKGTIITYMK